MSKKISVSNPSHASLRNADFISDVLKGELLLAEDAIGYQNELLKTKSGNHFLVREYTKAATAFSQVIIQTKDCVHSNFLLKNSGLKPLTETYYSEDGLTCEFIDELNNFYLVREQRDYRFEKLI